MSSAAPQQGVDAMRALALFVSAPAALGGVRLRARVSPARDVWLAALRTAAAAVSAPIVKLPFGLGDDRLIGGLDLSASLTAGRPVLEPGALVRADGGVALAPMAERLSASTAARLCAALDDGVVRVERDGFSEVTPARLGLVLLDEGDGPDEAPPPALVERMAFTVALEGLRPGDLPALDAARIAEAAERLPHVTADDEAIEALTVAAAEMGISSLLAPWRALSAARAAAALAGRKAVDEEDLALAARLVLGPRAVAAGADEQAEAQAPPPEPPSQQPDQTPEQGETPSEGDAPLQDMILDAARAALPDGVLAAALAARAAGPTSSGAAGAAQIGGRRGRPTPPRPGRPEGDARLDVVSTLRAAAPWSEIRRRARIAAGKPARKVEIRASDFRIRNRESRRESLIIFAVDASGSSAMRRLAEAKGAVELVLAESYRRRDHVALISFRGLEAELVLPPTRALARAKRALAAMAGGGPTPLASGLEAAGALAEAARRSGRSPSLVLLTDAQANVRLDGRGGRAEAHAEALEMARRLRGRQIAATLLDISPRPQARAEELAAALGARYAPLPRADAQALAETIRAEAT